MMMRFTPLRFAAALASALAAASFLSGCGTMETLQNLVPHHNVNDEQLNQGVIPRQTAGIPAQRPGEKPVVLAIASTDIDCPIVEVADGGAALHVGGADSASTRYQFNIGDTARQCDPAGPGQVSIKVGVKGSLVIGQAGSAGTFSAPLRVSIKKDGEKNPVFSKTYTVQATSNGTEVGEFQFVTDPMLAPMPTLQLANVYTIEVGFGSGGEKAQPTRRRRHRS